MHGDLWIATVALLDWHGSRFCDMLSLPCLRSTLAGASKCDCGYELNQARYERYSPGEASLVTYTSSCTQTRILSKRSSQRSTRVYRKSMQSSSAQVLDFCSLPS